MIAQLPSPYIVMSSPSLRFPLSVTLYLSLVLFLFSGCDDEEPPTNPGGESMAGAGADGGGASGGAGTEAGEAGAGESSSGEMGVASCMSDDACPPGTLCDLGEMACRVACNRDSECGPTASCVDSFCVERSPCEGGAGGTCGEGETCDCKGLCIPLITNPCQADIQCQVSEYCDPCQGQCRPRVAPCGACDDSLSCERTGDLCAPVGARGENYCLRLCTGQGSCDNLGPGYLCEAIGERGTFCVPERGECLGVTQCEQDAECEAGFFCNDRLQCQPACENDISCPDGLLCQGLRCGPPCTNDADCDPEEAVCEADGHCSIPGGCQSSRDCTEPETYCDLNASRCVSGCQVDNDCLDANQECVGGRCRPRGCSRNYQCSFGQVCDLESSMCVMAEGRHCEAGCDPMSSATSCGEGGQRCLSLQDEEENPLGDFCFEPCQPEPNACPQGYACQEIQDPNNGESFSICLRRCDLNP